MGELLTIDETAEPAPENAVDRAALDRAARPARAWRDAPQPVL